VIFSQFTIDSHFSQISNDGDNAIFGDGRAQIEAPVTACHPHAEASKERLTAYDDVMLADTLFVHGLSSCGEHV
jgi:hypothetical protein